VRKVENLLYSNLNLIFRALRHPNIVLFLGTVHPPFVKYLKLTTHLGASIQSPSLYRDGIHATWQPVKRVTHRGCREKTGNEITHSHGNGRCLWNKLSTQTTSCANITQVERGGGRGWRGENGGGKEVRQ
jgi:hypothetical protein